MGLDDPPRGDPGCGTALRHARQGCDRRALAGDLPHSGDTAPGAFDDAEDFARNDVIAQSSRLTMPEWIDHGDHDPFVPGDQTLTPKLHAQVHVWPGAHNQKYWGAHVVQYLRFFLRSCS